MRNAITLIVAALVLYGCGPKARTAAPEQTVKKGGPVLARVGDQTLTRDELMILFRGQVPPDVPKDRLKAVLESWANGEVWYQEAMRQGIGQDETTQLAIRNEEHNFIARMLLAKIQDTLSVTDADVYDYFGKHKQDYMVSTSIKYLTLFDSSLAETISGKIKGGADFDATAHDFSPDQVSPGGPTPYFVRNDTTIPMLQLSPELNQTIFGLQKNEVSGVVPVNVSGKSTFWIIKCVDRKQVKSDVRFDDVKATIRNELLPFKQQAIVESVTDQLNKKTKVEITEDNFYTPGTGARGPAGK